MNKKQFLKLTQQALESLPDFFKKHLENVHMVVEEKPTQMPKNSLILGRYQGIPQSKRQGNAYHGVLPDKITLYKANIEQVGRGEVNKIKELVIKTVEHEIAHHFGISDKRLKDLDLY